METNHGKITDFSVTKSGDIWIEVDEEIFNSIRNNDWESVILFPTTKTLMSLLPNWYPGCDDEEEGYEWENEEDDPYWFGWLRRVVIRCLEKTRPIDTLHHIYLYIVGVDFIYDGEYYYDDDGERKNCVEIGDEGWEDYYCIEISTSPKQPTSHWEEY